MWQSFEPQSFFETFSLFSRQSGLKYPIELAPRGDTVDDYTTANGSVVHVQDPYRFLEDPDSSATKMWVEAEKNLTDEYLKSCNYRSKFKQSLEESLNFPKTGLMKRHGDHYYFHHNTGLQNQGVYYRVKQKNSYKIDYKDPIKDSEVFLDPNTISDEGIASVFSMTWSEDNKYMAYMIQMGGSDWTTIKVRRGDSGTDLDDTINWVKFSGMSWTKDSKGFFYSGFDAPEDDMDKAAQKNKKLAF